MDSRESVSESKLCLWRDCVLYLGDSFDPDIHSHNAVQCCIALRGNLSVRWRENQEWAQCPAVVIDANVPHCIENPDGPLCIMYLERTSGNFRHILVHQGKTEHPNICLTPMFCALPPPRTALEKLNSALKEQISEEFAGELRSMCLDYFHGVLPEPVPLSDSVTRILHLLHRNPDKTFTGAELASEAGLSESRLQHLFKAQMGLPIRRYVLWMRLRYVINLVRDGITLTESAHAAGFADASHFTRTFKAMFGIAPSILFGRKRGIVPLFCGSPHLATDA